MQQTIAVADRLAVAEAKSIDEGPIRATGRVHICLRGPDGRVKDEETVDNLVVTTGRQHIADQMADQGAAAMSHMAIGTGTTAADATDTALITELDRNALTSASMGLRLAARSPAPMPTRSHMLPTGPPAMAPGQSPKRGFSIAQAPAICCADPFLL